MEGTQEEDIPSSLADIPNRVVVGILINTSQIMEVCSVPMISSFLK